MSGWYERAKAFVASTPAKAEDVEAEFDNIEEALNSLFPGGVARCSENLLLTPDTAYHDVPGTTVTLTPTVESKLFVVAVFDFICRIECRGTINVDGSDQAAEAIADLESHATSPQVYAITLAPGSHTVKMRARRTANIEFESILATDSGFLYLLVPAI
jgi:hypothetical protein